MRRDLSVRPGAVTITGLVGIIGSFLLAVATGLTTLVGALPADVATRYGVAITAVAGVVSAIGFAVLAFGKAYFAKVKTMLPDTPEPGSVEDRLAALDARLGHIEETQHELIIAGVREALNEERARELTVRR